MNILYLPCINSYNKYIYIFVNHHDIVIFSQRRETFRFAKEWRIFLKLGTATNVRLAANFPLHFTPTYLSLILGYYSKTEWSQRLLDLSPHRRNGRGRKRDKERAKRREGKDKLVGIDQTELFQWRRIASGTYQLEMRSINLFNWSRSLVRRIPPPPILVLPSY